MPDSPLSLENVKSAIAANLRHDVDIPDGHRGAMVTFLNQDKVEVALATRIIDNHKASWDVELIGQHNWTGGNNSIGVMSKITW